MNLEELNYDELLKMKPYDGDLVFNVNGMTADEYISKITEEMNAIDLSSIPIDKWDIVVTFSLAALEVAGLVAVVASFVSAWGFPGLFNLEVVWCIDGSPSGSHACHIGCCGSGGDVAKVEFPSELEVDGLSG